MGSGLTYGYLQVEKSVCGGVVSSVFLGFILRGDEFGVVLRPEAEEAADDDAVDVSHGRGSGR